MKIMLQRLGFQTDQVINFQSMLNGYALQRLTTSSFAIMIFFATMVTHDAKNMNESNAASALEGAAAVAWFSQETFDPYYAIDGIFADTDKGLGHQSIMIQNISFPSMIWRKKWICQTISFVVHDAHTWA
jgi:hypothetical protein